MNNELKKLEKLPDKPVAEKRNTNDYAEVAETFAKSCVNSIKSMQEGGARTIEQTNAHLAFRFGVICQTDDYGTPNMQVTDKDCDMSGGSIRQAFFIGTRAEAAGKVAKYVSTNMRSRRMPKPFKVTSQFDDAIQKAIPAAQKEGDDVQAKIDDMQYKWYPMYFGEHISAHLDFDPEPDPDLVLMKNLTSLASGTVAEQLGTRIDKLQVVFAKFTDGAVISDSTGTETDVLISRVSLSIHVKTTKGNEAFGTIRGSSGTLLDILARDVLDESMISPEKLKKDPNMISRDPNVIVARLARRVAREAESKDRVTLTSAILGKDFYVILPSHATGVFVHEQVGHPHESDIQVENDRDPKSKIKLKGTMGARISNHQKFCVYDTPEPDYKVGKRQMRYSWGGMPTVDEYGTPAKVAVLVEGGRNVGVMSNHVTFEEIASSLEESLQQRMREVGLTGNSRSQKYDVPTQVRMRTTFATPDEDGPKSVQEMAARIPGNAKGIYVKTINGGFINPSDGTFVLQVGLGYLIENSQITTKPMKDIKLAGNITTFQDNIDTIGSSLTVKYPFTGFCGKADQWVPVEGIGPAICLKKITLGGGGFLSWDQLVEEYDRQHLEVTLGVRTTGIHIPEIANHLPPDENQNHVCLVTTYFSPEKEVEWIKGEGPDHSTHEYVQDKDGVMRLRERGDLYDN